MSAEKWQALLDDHAASVREFSSKAQRAADSRWLVPRAEGKWTPAQETRHLILTYDAFLRDARGQGTLRLRGNATRRFFWRLFGLNWILHRKRIPVAVRAPREIRADEEFTPASDLIPQFEARSREFTAVIGNLQLNEPARTFTHPLFGQMSIEQTLRALTVHNRHHAAFLP
jgi:hypothetical protein